jgi:hypothetical protein
VLAGCGGGDRPEQRVAPQPRLPRTMAQDFATRADRVADMLAANDTCGAMRSANTLRDDIIAAINAHQVPRALQEPLLSSSNSLVARIGVCSPPDRRGKKDDKGPGHGPKKGHEKHRRDD